MGPSILRWRVSTETGNDDFGARYYSSSFGRWLSPDWSAIPAPVPYANLTNPQTLNLYAMVRDNPEMFADLDGHNDQGGGGDSSVAPGGDNSGDSNGASPAAPQDKKPQPQPQQQPQPVVTMKVLVPTGKIAADQTETVAGFGVEGIGEAGRCP